jgi:hypothetical protein
VRTADPTLFTLTANTGQLEPAAVAKLINSLVP